MVMNIGALKSRKDDLVQADIEAVVNRADGRIVKVIIETWVLMMKKNNGPAGWWKVPVRTW